MFRQLLFLVALGGTCAYPNSGYSQVSPDVILEKVMNTIVSIRVHGIARVDDPPRPPFWGTGVIIPPVPGEKRLRILTAGHVVERDEFWSSSGSGVDRLVYPQIMTEGGSAIVQPFRGVTVSDLWDVAQVVGPRNILPATIGAMSMSSTQQYFVVSWGKADNYDAATEEPYIKEVRVAPPANGEPEVPTGMVLLQVVSADENARFKESESGSPVFDSNGVVVAIVVKERVDPATGIARQGIAVPILAVSQWVDGRGIELSEPKIVELEGTMASATARAFLDKLSGGCVFLGKYSARVLNEGDDRALADAPFGLETLRRVIEQFPEQNPNEISDELANVRQTISPAQVFLISGDGAVNLRSRCPEVVPKPRRTNSNERIAYYGAPLAKADATFQISIGTIQRQAYLDDFFYWGTIERIKMRSD